MLSTLYLLSILDLDGTSISVGTGGTGRGIAGDLLGASSAASDTGIGGTGRRSTATLVDPERVSSSTFGLSVIDS